MDVRILGPLEVLHDGRPVALGGGRQRALLALLVLERNRPVSGDRIVEELWNGDAPATAAKVVQNLISQLRRELPAGHLHTRGRGYELELPDQALDAGRFERLLDDGRRALAAGEPERAADTLREALELWRGPSLGELGGEPWARTETARLAEQRLVALERRIDADLALGRHAEVVSELEAAVAREPLREGLRAQLMLALYRDGRQAEALAAYADARRTLVGELGIEPGPALTRLHEAILRQDEGLAAPAPPRTAPTRRRWAGRLLVAGGLLLALAAAAILLDRDEPAAVVAPGGGELVGLDAATGKVERHIPAGRTPAVVAVEGGRVWAVDSDARTLLKIDPSSGSVDTLATGATPIDVSAGSGAIWVANGRRREVTQAVGPIPDELVRLDPATARQDAAVPLPAAGAAAESGRPGQLAVSRGAVWAVTPDASVVRIDPDAGRITKTVRRINAFAVAAGGAGVWVLVAGGRLAELDERTGRIRRRTKLPSRALGALAVGDDAVWVAGSVEGKLWRVGRGRGDVIGSVDVEAGATAVASSGRRVWLANGLTGTVTVVDGAAMRVIDTVRVGGAPRGLAVAGGTVWVAVTGTGAAPASSTVSGVETLPASMCRPAVAGRDGRADALVVSDLPLSGDERLGATQMAQAITFLMRERGFRAGRLRLAFQSCDDGLAGPELFDEAKCAANGRAYAADKDVLGVIGTYNSGCVFRMIPPLNRAPGGPLGIVSPVNSYTGLTRALDDGDELARLYPTGKRNFARIYPADDLQGGALAELARDRGRRRVFVLEDGDVYSTPIADAFAAAARRLGLEVAGRRTWNKKARDYKGLAERVARSGADAVMVSGLIANNAGRVIHELRRRLGSGVDVMGPDGIAPPALLWRAAGPAARGVFFSAGGLPTDQLPPPGTAFAQRFSRTQSGAPVEPFSVYAAHAAEVLLDAIARSDGTRASVIEQLFATDTPGGLTGPVEFDARGDTVHGAITILRVERPGRSPTIGSVDGAEVERITRVSPELIER